MPDQPPDPLHYEMKIPPEPPRPESEKEPGASDATAESDTPEVHSEKPDSRDERK